MSNRGYVPASELEGQVSDFISWDAVLPNEAVPEKVGVHVGRLEWLAKRAGFGSVAIHGYWGKKTEYVPQIGGMAEHGLAFGARSLAAAKAELKSTRVDQPGFGDSKISLHEYFRAHGDISLNLAKIEQRVNQTVRRKDPKKWAKFINAGLKDGMQQIAYKNLWSERTKMERMLGITVNGAIPAMVETASQIGSNRPQGLEGNLGLAATILLSIEMLNAITIVAGKNVDAERKEKRPRASLFPFIQFDRLAVVALSTDYMRLAKAISNNT